MAQRYQALRGCSAGVIILINLFCLVTKSPAASPDTSRQEIQRIFDQLRKSHGLHLAWENIDAFEGGGMSFEVVSESDLSRFLSFLRIFKEEIDRYPADFFKPSGLTRIIFVKKLFKQNQVAHGVYRLPGGYMYFDIYRHFRNRQLQRHGIHHEIFHMISTSMWVDPVILPEGWEGLNEPGFKYEKEGWWHSDKIKSNSFGPPRHGFVTEYAISSEEEDKAEIFACLLVKPQRRLIEKWGEKDLILRKKIDAMKKILESYSPRMNASFWGGPVKE